MNQSPRKPSPSSSYQIWTAHLKEDKDVQDFTKSMKALEHNLVLRRLIEILVKYREDSAKASISTRNYDSPSWAYIQADSAGYQRALMTIETLLKGFVKA